MAYIFVHLQMPLVERIVRICRPYLSAVSKEYESAAVVMMRLLTRWELCAIVLRVHMVEALTEMARQTGHSRCTLGQFYGLVHQRDPNNR